MVFILRHHNSLGVAFVKYDVIVLPLSISQSFTDYLFHNILSFTYIQLNCSCVPIFCAMSCHKIYIKYIYIVFNELRLVLNYLRLLYLPADFYDLFIILERN